MKNESAFARLTEWQDISTAPKDEMCLIAHAATEDNKAFAGQVFTVPVYIDEAGVVIDLETHEPEVGILHGMWRASHWMPLPEPPVSS